ncbi:MAG: ATP-binding cassette domain-containing protein [Syntrophomonadaceae bacterium]|nr:ATP-binding cassette domain-containing protein [Syntrophomonadaceae bacterium]
MSIPRGRKVVILGANGAGKSTLFLHLNGILRPKSGRVLVEGQEVEYSRSHLSELRKKVGIIFQDPDQQLFSVNVFQDISFGPMNLKYPRAEVKRRVEQAMEITRVADLQGRPTHQLSHGQKKRVAIAGVLAMDPEVIILDEPTASLEPCLVEEMMQLFETLHQAGKTLIMSTHDMDLAYGWADLCFVLNQGRVVAHGSPEEIFSDQPLLRQNNLQQPWVLKVREKLTAMGLLAASICPPRTEAQLFAAMNCIDSSGMKSNLSPELYLASNTTAKS